MPLIYPKSQHADRYIRNKYTAISERLVLLLDNALSATDVDVCAGARDICPPPAASAAPHIRPSAASDCCARDLLPLPAAGLPRPAGGQRPAVTLAHYLFYGTADRMLANVRAWRCRFTSLSRRLDGALATHILRSGRSWRSASQFILRSAKQHVLRGRSECWHRWLLLNGVQHRVTNTSCGTERLDGGSASGMRPISS